MKLPTTRTSEQMWMQESKRGGECTSKSYTLRGAVVPFIAPAPMLANEEEEGEEEEENAAKEG